MSDKPELMNAKFLYTQDGNTDGTTAEIEGLEVEIEGLWMSDDVTGYVVIRTDTGWSLDDPIELFNLLNDAQKSVKKMKEREHE